MHLLSEARVTDNRLFMLYERLYAVPGEYTGLKKMKLRYIQSESTKTM